MSAESARVSFINDPRIRGYIWQVVVFGALVWLFYTAASNAIVNLRAAKIASGLGFWNVTAGFDIGQAFIPYSATSSYGQAFWVGLVNTLYVSIIGIFFATLLGFAVGVARLSTNFVVAKLAAAYVEIVRNTPLLLQLFVWYNAVLKPLPGPRQSIEIPFLKLALPTDWLQMGLAAGLIAAGIYMARESRRFDPTNIARLAMTVGGALVTAFGVWRLVTATGLFQATGSVLFLNNRGLYLPEPQPQAGFNLVLGVLAAGIVGAIAFRFWAHRRQEATGQQYPVGVVALGLVIVLPLFVFLLSGRPLEFGYPVLRGFNLAGGWQIYPEFVALLLGLVIYTAAFIAENVRAGILAVSKGQTEAAYALGLRPKTTMNLVVIPQAMRVIIPPLTSQYLNLTKNSSLAVAIGYPDLVQVFMGTVLNQTGQAIEVIAITMLVYLTLSLTTSLIMNIYNARKALVER